jgi:hypothetical protein
MDHLQDPATYKRLDSIPIEEIKDAVVTFYKALVRAIPDEKTTAEIIIAALPSSSSAYFHALPKVHKTPMGIRPIVSNVTSPTNGLSKWLTYKLLPLTKLCTSYLRDSDHAHELLTSLPVRSEAKLVSLDVEAMYTSIPTTGGHLHQAIRWFLIQTRTPPIIMEYILRGLNLVLTYNYFTFGATCWQQRNGIAMGTPVAPILATLYLGYHEEVIILPRFQRNLYFYKRYLDDILVLWLDSPENPYAWNAFLAHLRRVPGLSWTHKIHQGHIDFLDLTIYPQKDQCYATRTYQKALNLYLYPPYSSAHSPATKLGFIYGLILKYWKQNTRRSDFIHVCKLTFERLLARGYPRPYLRSIFHKALLRLEEMGPTTCKQRSVKRDHYYRIPYDPHGPSKAVLRSHLGFGSLSHELSMAGYGKVTICYLKPPSLSQLIGRTRLTSIEDTRAESDT